MATTKQQFAQDTIQAEEPEGGLGGGRSNLGYIERRLKDKVFRNCPVFTDADEEFVEGIRLMLSQGTIAKKVAQTIKKEFERTMDSLEMLIILRKHIRIVDDYGRRKNTRTQARHEVILSGYLVGLENGNGTE